MTSIFFDEASANRVSNSSIPAFRVDNDGGAASVWAENNAENAALVGVNNGNGEGIRGVSNGEHGAVVGVNNTTGHAVFGVSNTGEGVHGETTSNDHAAVVAVQNGGAFAIHAIGTRAGRFEGNVEVKGDISLVNADCAEDFDVADSELSYIEAGTVMVLNEKGSLQPSYQEYDKKVAGVISGASGYKPAIILGRQQSQNNHHRFPVALIGKVYCKVDARHSSIEIGDLLTTSSTKGYAMKVDDPMKAFGTVIGKALGSIKEGLGMIPVLIALQ
jgi:hypothetical protein